MSNRDYCPFQLRLNLVMFNATKFCDRLWITTVS
uniref:Uncharacterized protein n=1 Tax=Arundo donax TaxID=35708 RepID=A0A0A9AW18_ARUDO